jgi:methionyl-tRNA formyltransferase
VRIVFIGASGFGMRAAETLARLADCQLVGVVTAPRQFSISYRPTGVTNVLFADLSEFASARDIPYHILNRGMNDPELFRVVCNWQPDCFVVVGWYHMVPASWRKLAPAYGLHASLLPNYSGGAPLVWAMINGEARTGITLFQFDDGVDSGPILGSLATNITHDDTIATLYSRIEDLGLKLLKKNLPLLARGAGKFIVQDESQRRVFPQRGPEDGKIDWTQHANRIHDFIRAQTRPYPGAFSCLSLIHI